MFCPNCGNNIPDDSAFCGHCGTSFAATAPVATAAAPVPGTSAKQRGLSKKQFLATEAAPGVKAASKIALGVFAAILALILLATITLNTISVVDLPIIKMAVDESEREELTDIMDEGADVIDEFDDLLEEIEEEFGSKTARQAKKMVNKYEKMIRKFSLANTIAAVEAAHDLSTDAAEKLDLKGEIEELEELVKILKTVRTVIYIFGVVIALLALWAAAGKAVFPCVLGLLLGGIVYCLLASVLLGILIVVAFIVLAVFCSKVNKAWKKVAI